MKNKIIIIEGFLITIVVWLVVGIFFSILDSL